MYSDKITQNVALAVMKVMEEELSAKQKNIAAVAGDPKKIDAEDFKKLRKEDAEPLDELSESAKKSYTVDDIDDHLNAVGFGRFSKKFKERKKEELSAKQKKIAGIAKGKVQAVKNEETEVELNEAGFGGFSKKYKLKAAERRKKEALKAKQKKIDAEDFKKLRKEDTVAEAKYEPAKPDAAAVLRRKKLQAIEDRKEKAKAAPSNVRKHEGSAYGGAKQKDEMDESMDVAKSLAQKGMNSEPGSTTSIKRKDGKVTSWQVTGPMKKTGASDSMARARSLAQKGMKLPEETTFSGLLASIHENGLITIHEMFVRESASEEEFNTELKIAQEKSEGKGKKAEIAKGQVQAVKNEETEVVEYELDVNAINGVKMETIDERHLTAAETEKKEDTVKSMKKGMAGFKERYGDRAKEVMYATATKQAKKDA